MATTTNSPLLIGVTDDSELIHLGLADEGGAVLQCAPGVRLDLPWHEAPSADSGDEHRAALLECLREANWGPVETLCTSCFPDTELRAAYELAWSERNPGPLRCMVKGDEHEGVLTSSDGWLEVQYPGCTTIVVLNLYSGRIYDRHPDDHGHDARLIGRFPPVDRHTGQPSKLAWATAVDPKRSRVPRTDGPTGARKYDAVADVIRERITSGQYKRGEQLPGERELAQDLRVYSLTLRKAMAVLMTEGLIEKWHGMGTWVAGDVAVEQRPVQVAAVVRAEIEQGKLLPGAKLQTQAEMVDRFGCSLGVISEAIAILRADGLVEVIHGVGSFVTGAEPKGRKHEIVAAALRAAIASSELPPGTRLLNQTELAAQFGVNGRTVRAAVAELITEGLLEYRVGFGTYVTRTPVETGGDGQ